ncbi:MAG: LUD domain-containing protein [Bacteroidota bacterium]
MNNREKILAAVKNNQPAWEALPSLNDIDAIRFENPREKFKSVLEGIGGTLLVATDLQQVQAYIQDHFAGAGRCITSMNELPDIEQINSSEDAHKLDNTEVAIIGGAFGVAENAAIWVTASSVIIRALPFICQQLVVVLSSGDMVNNMHEAYDRIAAADYDYGVFIAGPSKTADIEQSLVLGAHGPKSMTVFLIELPAE